MKAKLLKTSLLGLTLLSAVGFSISSFIARLFFQSSLPDLIQLQTGSVFLAFVIQGGLRAGLRNQHHLGRKRVVAAVEQKIFQLLPFFAGVVSLSFLLQNRWALLPAYATLHATLTLLIGLKIAQGNMHSTARYSVLTFVSILVPCLIVMLSGRPLMQLRMPIEGASWGCLCLLAWNRRPSRLAGRALFQVFMGSLGMQVGAFAVYLSGYILGNYIVWLSKGSLAYAVAFADVQILCGVQSLLFGRVVLFFEGKLIESNRVGWLTERMILWGCLFSLLVTGCLSLYQPFSTAALYGVLTFSILGREALAMVFQFMLDKYRFQAICLALLSAGGLACAQFLQFGGVKVLLAVGVFSPGFVAIVLVLRAHFMADGYYLQRVRREAPSLN